jgi:hypothetical protein
MDRLQRLACGSRGEGAEDWLQEQAIGKLLQLSEGQPFSQRQSRTAVARMLCGQRHHQQQQWSVGQPK